MNLYGYVVNETVELLLVTFPYWDVIFSEGTGLTDIERYISLRAPPFIAGLY